MLKYIKLITLELIRKQCRTNPLHEDGERGRELNFRKICNAKSGVNAPLGLM